MVLMFLLDNFFCLTDNCCAQAWEYYVMYPSFVRKLRKTASMKRKRKQIDGNLEMPNIRIFVKCLSRYVTELPLTYPGSLPLLECSKIFMPILTNVQRVSLNLKKTPAQDSGNLIQILRLILKSNKHLSCALIQFNNMIYTSEEDFQLVWKALYISSKDQLSWEKEIKEVCNLSTSTISADEDLYDCAFEPLSDSNHSNSNHDNNFNVVVDSPISSLVLSISNNHKESFRTLHPALSQWRNLRSLCLNFHSSVGVDIVVADFSSMIDGLVNSAQLRHLALLNFHCEQHEKAILKIAAPNTYTCNASDIHPPNAYIHHPANAPVHPPSTRCHQHRLESLTLSLCTFRTAMLEHIIVENTPCDHVKRDEQSSTTLSCLHRGLTSLEISWDDIYDEDVNSFLRKNRHLKELKMKLQYFQESAFRGLLCAVQGKFIARACTQDSTVFY